MVSTVTIKWSNTASTYVEVSSGTVSMVSRYTSWSPQLYSAQGSPVNVSSIPQCLASNTASSVILTYCLDCYSSNYTNGDWHVQAWGIQSQAAPPGTPLPHREYGNPSLMVGVTGVRTYQQADVFYTGQDYPLTTSVITGLQGLPYGDGGPDNLFFYAAPWLDGNGYTYNIYPAQPVGNFAGQSQRHSAHAQHHCGPPPARLTAVSLSLSPLPRTLSFRPVHRHQVRQHANAVCRGCTCSCCQCLTLSFPCCACPCLVLSFYYNGYQYFGNYREVNEPNHESVCLWEKTSYTYQPYTLGMDPQAVCQSTIAPSKMWGFCATMYGYTTPQDSWGITYSGYLQSTGGTFIDLAYTGLPVYFVTLARGTRSYTNYTSGYKETANIVYMQAQGGDAGTGQWLYSAALH